eukprot:CAMPEP_0180154334 /NCGR_PEP_ID=MMETSP0986-20121125/24100_1 /TAXON_ID=697907 /ORGANISM="non described non described, Strain CCMP2293" /LENGTH=166 /DNA_ID=CAMNT_0022102675 /DNA_START=13 /DNA_END=513 /DNA_ORIENTATION=+
MLRRSLLLALLAAPLASAFAPCSLLPTRISSRAVSVARGGNGAAIAPAVRPAGLQLRMAEKGPLHDAIDKVVKETKVVVFMKGNKDFPQCGFSNTVVQVLKACKTDFECINVLENEMLRQGIKTYSQWPTIPQLYVDGEFLGGADIVVDMYQSGELQEMIEKVNAE